jgi:hypothetical protein
MRSVSSVNSRLRLDGQAGAALRQQLGVVPTVARAEGGQLGYARGQAAQHAARSGVVDERRGVREHFVQGYAADGAHVGRQTAGRLRADQHELGVHVRGRGDDRGAGVAVVRPFKGAPADQHAGPIAGGE